MKPSNGGAPENSHSFGAQAVVVGRQQGLIRAIATEDE